MEETVNKNIEKYQTPNWRGHPSMIGTIESLSCPYILGWCQMNYPSHLVDKRHKREPSPKDEPADLSFIHQKRPISSAKNTQIYKPISNISKDKSVTRQEGVGSPPKGFKASVYTLATTPMEDRTFLVRYCYKESLNLYCIAT